MRSAAAHGAVLALFGVLAALFSRPLPRLLTSGVLGEGAGDNASVVWNFWWARTALSSPDLSLFWTPHLFAPIGTSLVSHTLNPLLTVAAALLPFDADPLFSYNVAILTAVFLNFAVAYAAAYSITQDRLSSVFAGITFGGAPFLLARVYGHLNLLSAWALPLLLIVTGRYYRQPTVGTALSLAAAIAVVAYTDYYYLIFGLLLIALHLGLSQRLVRVRARPWALRRRRSVVLFAALIGIVSVLIAWIQTTGGADTTIAGVRLRMTDTFNPRVALGFLLAGALLAWKRPRISFVPAPEAMNGRVWRLLPITGLATALLLAPVLVWGARLWLAGDYATQTYFWRSAPPGIDIATIFMGNPLGVVSGGWTTSMLERLEINRMEGTAWLGVAPLVMLVVAIRRLRSRPDVQKYLWIAGVFFVWSLGPYLRAFGVNTAFMLPQTFIRFVPVLANARIPGRAIVVVQLMIALLGALALATFRRSSPRGTAIALVAILAVTLDSWPRSHPWSPFDRPALYAAVRAMPPGIVLEVPLGLADGFATRGAFDYRVLFYQTLHEHPQMGGAISRISPRVRAAFEADPVVRPILDLSEGVDSRIDALPAPPCRNSLVCNVRYVVIAETAPEALKGFVTKAFSLRSLGQEAGRAFYRVEHIPACECSR